MWYEIHPSIGVARIGSSATTDPGYYFFGPEPGCADAEYAKPNAEYKAEYGRVRYDLDAAAPVARYRVPNGRLKRQAVRFRVFECDDSQGTLVRREIDYDRIAVEWIVDVANRKAAGLTFNDGKPGSPKRNEKLTAKELVIKSGTRFDRISGAAQGPNPVRGSFTGIGHDIELVQLATDAKGRLIVVGPAADSGTNGVTDPTHYADNDGWYDNTSDGPVLAKLYDKANNKPITEEVRNAWVIVTPFDFAPDVDSFVTLYDVCRQACADAGLLPAPNDTFFGSDVLPLLKRVRGYRWVNGPTIRAETQDRHKSWRDLEANLSDPLDPLGAKYREMLLAHIPNPNGDPAGKRQVLMPRLHSGDPTFPVLALTNIQYAHLERWSSGQFDPRVRPGVEYLPDALDRIALDACSGGAFYPGMEVPRLMKETAIYASPFRLRPRLEDELPVDPSAYEPQNEKADQLLSGQLTEGLAVPWQSDFWQCQMERDNAWWPATRPDHVFVKEPALPIDSQSEEIYRWDEGITSEKQMVKDWDRLGVVKRRKFDKNFDSHDPRVIADAEGSISYFYFAEDERDVGALPHKHHSSGD